MKGLVNMVKYTTPNELGRKALQGVEFVPIKRIENGIQVYKKKIDNCLIYNHCMWLMEKAMQDMLELQFNQRYEEHEKPKNMDEYIQFFKKDKSDFVLIPCTDSDRIARIISLLQECLAIMLFIRE
jgi:hypothetical protein